MFLITQSYSSGWRVFIPKNANNEVHEFFKQNCIWRGHDKTEEVCGIECLGYEFNSIEAATIVVNNATLLWHKR